MMWWLLIGVHDPLEHPVSWALLASPAADTEGRAEADCSIVSSCCAFKSHQGRAETDCSIVSSCCTLTW